jgi:large subunit ribosomal protein L17
MRHQVHGKKLNRSTGHRKALYRNLAQSLVEHERITTTLPKAKAIRPVVEKMITRAKKQDLAARRAVLAYLPTETAADKVYTVLAVRFAGRPGGYTRIIKTGRRAGDGAEMAVLELVELSAPEVKKAARRQGGETANKEGRRQEAEGGTTNPSRSSSSSTEPTAKETTEEKKPARRSRTSASKGGKE